MKYLSNVRLTRQQIILGILLLVIVYVAIATLNVIARNYQLQQQVDRLTQENAILELQNQQLRYEITYYSTDAFVEKEARAKLGLQAPGESTVIFSDKIPETEKPPEPEAEPTLNETLADNFKHWVYFLFRLDLN